MQTVDSTNGHFRTGLERLGTANMGAKRNVSLWPEWAESCPAALGWNSPKNCHSLSPGPPAASRPTPDSRTRPVMLPRFLMVGMLRFGMTNQKESVVMKCLRIYATPEGKSHFDEIELPTTKRSVHPDAVPLRFRPVIRRPASDIRLEMDLRVKPQSPGRHGRSSHHVRHR